MQEDFLTDLRILSMWHVLTYFKNKFDSVDELAHSDPWKFYHDIFCWTRL